ncbi:tyrosine-protein kinase receptor Tie-1 [Caerostris extrusa]|uniref:Tyrosine-protein kinase receptor Tie-1 n=1 Tax=Caerostris extrusa TaxID=172846 RepID=A0AAV4U6Q5_CAEEX|nr:tyrosine-protein kinase receptor Tie-1 [Caerostris extrusa]
MYCHQIFRIVIVLLLWKSTDAVLDLGEVNCTVTGFICPSNETCSATCKRTCAQNEDIWGTVVYAFFSRLCKSALQDFRISLWNTSERTFLFKHSWDATFYGSNRLGISSKSHANKGEIQSYKFFSPYISESILDIVSLHRGYLFEEKANHIQECFVFGKYPNIKFSMYNKRKVGK